MKGLSTNESSSDSDVGRRPELKSDEFCDANVKVIEIVSHLRLKPQKQVVQLLAARPQAYSRTTAELQQLHDSRATVTPPTVWGVTRGAQAHNCTPA